MDEFKLFISGETAKTDKIFSALEFCLTAVFGDAYSLQKIDVIKNPLMAQADGVMATPTLVRMNPPMKRVLGDFSDMTKILESLNIHMPLNKDASAKE
ncbi:MAG: hypothetical protein H8D87_12105 [Deltaproteobacteria bacterium]|uniref:circadian clock KaiB family protein n=1 Tax=Desulfobacula sp. TaxID=2593537 RepID=UPI0019AD48FE|nr:hypothetical protein [Candidatus Desulfobacula maris]MBL6993101.1 hypothetical protein [Desulfobacula sp.]